MKILQISPFFYPALEQGGGMVPAVYNLSKELVKRGHDVTVYTTDTIDSKTRQKAKFIEIEGIKVYYFRNLSNKLACDNISLPLGMFSQIAKRIRDFDIIHLQDYRFIPNVAAYYCATKYGIPYVCQPRYSYNTFFQKGRLKKIYDFTFGDRVLQNAAMLIAQLPTEAREYQDLGINIEKIMIMPNGVDLREISDLPKRGTFREKYEFDDEHKIVLYLGRIDYCKGVDLLIEAYTNLIKKLDKVVLVIVGPDAGYLAKMKKLIRDLGVDNQVLFTGSLVGKNKLAAYIDADVYVMPSRHEGLSIAPLEAYVCGTPIIVTDRCGTGEWMADEFDYIVPYDKERLEEAIIQTLNNINPERYSESERERRLNLLRERFSREIVAKMTEDVYRKVLFGV